MRATDEDSVKNGKALAAFIGETPLQKAVGQTGKTADAGEMQLPLAEKWEPVFTAALRNAVSPLGGVGRGVHARRSAGMLLMRKSFRLHLVF